MEYPKAQKPGTRITCTTNATNSSSSGSTQSRSTAAPPGPTARPPTATGGATAAADADSAAPGDDSARSGETLRLVFAQLVIAAVVCSAASPAAATPPPQLVSVHVGGVAASGLPGAELSAAVRVANGSRLVAVAAVAADPGHVVTVAGTAPGAPRFVAFDANTAAEPVTRTAELILTVSDAGRSVRYRLTVTATVAARASRYPRTPAPTAAEPVYLTFDDGPDPVQTPAVLDVLRAHGARATFFVTGERAAAHPGLIERIVSEGHTVANHTWAHRRADDMTADEFRLSLLAAQHQLGPHAAACFRPPQFATAPWMDGVLDAVGLRLVMADANPRDWQHPGADVLAGRIVALARPGATIVLHDGIGRLAGQTAPALDTALHRLAGRGLHFAPVC